MEAKKTIKQIFKMNNFLFDYMRRDFLLDFDAKLLNMSFFAKYSNLCISDFLEMFIENDEISEENKQNIADMIYFKYRNAWKKYYDVYKLKYTAHENYNMIEREELTNENKQKSKEIEINDNFLKQNNDARQNQTINNSQNLTQNMTDSTTQTNTSTNANTIKNNSDVTTTGAIANSITSNSTHLLENDKILENEKWSVNLNNDENINYINALGSSDLSISDKNISNKDNSNYDKEKQTQKAYTEKDNTTSSNVQNFNNHNVKTVSNDSNSSTLNSSLKDSSEQNLTNTATNKSSSENDERNILENELSMNKRNEKTEVDNQNQTRKLTRAGNIGITTTQQMLASELELWKWNLFNSMFSDIASEICINIFRF